MKNMYSKENLAKIETMNNLAPDVMTAFWAFDKASVAEGAIPVKYKELIAVAVALTTQCPYCIEIHSGNARAAGVTDTELVEAAMVAAALRAGGAVTHANARAHRSSQRRLKTVEIDSAQCCWGCHSQPWHRTDQFRAINCLAITFVLVLLCVRF
jgi:AhpD family alkylhydroperoxidase